MKRFQYVLMSLILISVFGCQKQKYKVTVTSPLKTNSIQFMLNEHGEASYSVKHNDSIVIGKSLLNIEFKESINLSKDLILVESEINTVNETWEMPWGEQQYVTNFYNELKVKLRTKENFSFHMFFRAYDDGIAFRYDFPDQDGFDTLHIIEEQTEFQLTEDYTTYWIPGDWDIYEHLYNTTKFSEIDAMTKVNPDLAQSFIPENAVNTPVTLKSNEGLHLSFHEASLIDYSGMTLAVDTSALKFTSNLVGSKRMDYKVKRGLPFKTPWRSIQIADKAKDLIDSRLIVNLNEPNTLGDVSWFEPQKYVGIWWEMHIDKARWDYGMTLDQDGNWVDTGQAHGMHGATTENTKRYIDFASKNGIKGVLVEGWNTGWERWIGFEDREGVFDFVTPYPDYNLEEISDYAKSKNVEIIMHHETSAATDTYTKQQDTAYALMQKYGMHAVKSGYVGKILPKGEYHHGQFMVNHYNNAAIKAAKYKVAVNAHEPIKATGLRRTYPNIISREGLRGQEFNAWSSDGGNPPEHLSIVAFTRMLGGPIDFTPGVFDIELPTKPNNQINTTLAHQLALYVIIYSPIQMACDLPENYENQPAFQFIKDVGVDWQQSITLDGEVGDFVSIARQEKKTGHWFVGAITDEKAREVNINFDFLEKDTTYIAHIYKDGEMAHYQKKPKDIIIEELEINSNINKVFKLKEGGGLAISLKKK